MLEKMDIVRQIAGTDTSVLILGEAGVGKGLVAEQIHVQSRYANDPFVSVNCLTDALNIAPELETGTVFFDEISVLNLPLQEEVLRLLKSRGEVAPNTAGKLRIVASTKGDLEKMIEEKRFIRELYYQLNILPIYIPPLRQRVEDIMPLALYFLQLNTHNMKRHFDGFTDEAVSALQSAYWKGNVRELSNCIERACFNCEGNNLDEDSFFLRQEYQNKRVGGGNYDLKIALDSFKKSFVEQVLEKHAWNQTVTAQVLGIQRTYLSKLIKDLKITRK